MVGESLFPSTVEKYVYAFAKLQVQWSSRLSVLLIFVKAGKKMVVGRDSRVSGPWMRAVAHGILVAMGYEVVDLGIATTPTVQVRLKCGSPR